MTTATSAVTRREFDALSAKLDALIALATQGAVPASPAPEPKAPAKPDAKAKAERAAKRAAKAAEPRCHAIKPNGRRCRQHGAAKLRPDGLCHWHGDRADKGDTIARIDDVAKGNVIVTTPASSEAAATTCRGTTQAGQPCARTVGLNRAGFCKSHTAQARQSRTVKVAAPALAHNASDVPEPVASYAGPVGAGLPNGAVVALDDATIERILAGMGVTRLQKG